jgi:hypothetical protein
MHLPSRREKQHKGGWCLTKSKPIFECPGQAEVKKNRSTFAIRAGRCSIDAGPSGESIQVADFICYFFATPGGEGSY